MGDNSEDTLTTLAGRLTRLDKQLTPAEQTKFKATSGGASISDVAKSLLNAFDEDYVAKSGKTSEKLARTATEPFNNPKLHEFVETVRKAHDQIIDNTNLDTVNVAAWSGDFETKAKDYITSFRQFIEDNKDEITALSIFYTGTWRTRAVTYRMIEEVYEGMQKAGISPERLWSAYTIVRKDDVKAKAPINRLIDIVSMIRFELGQTAELKPYSVIVDFNFMKWTLAKNAGHIHFTEEQMTWLRWVKDFIAESLAITKEDLDLSPFVDHGGLGKFYELFGDQYETLLDEMNLALAA
jgi:type I restriction enzyme, R subunit